MSPILFSSFLYCADQTARISAETARKSAEHIPRVERAYLHGGGEPIGIVTGPRMASPRTFRHSDLILITTEKLRANRSNTELDGAKSARSIACCSCRNTNGITIEILSNRTRQDRSSASKCRVSGISRNVIFGKFGYRDIFGERAFEWIYPTRGKPIKAPHDLLYRGRPPWDLSHVGSADEKDDD